MAFSHLHSKISGSHAALHPDDLQGEQAALWSVLPACHRALLCQWNGGLLEEGQFCFDAPIPYFKDGQRLHDHQTDSVVELFGFHPPGETRAPQDLAKVKKEHESREFLPLGVVAVAECLGNSLICLSTRSEDSGAVYYWDYYWKYPWCSPFFEPRVHAAKQAFPDLAAIRSDPLHPQRRAAADALNYATLVRLADDFDRWLGTGRRS